MGGSAPRRDQRLPVETTSFVDRRGELAAGRELLARARLVTLTGPGGVGKTRLAARIAAGVRRTFPDGVRFAPLSGLDDPALVPHAVADALDLHDHTARPPLQALVEQLRDRRLLLLIDNCEHLLPACAELAAALLHGTTGVRILATSRHRLGLTEEHLLDVRPLPVPDPDGDLSSPEGYPALALFADRAAAVVPGFRLTAANRAAVARLCRRLDGLPLAIELAAVRMRVLDVDRLLDRLDDRYRLLTGGSPAALPRHQTLRAAVDWSHELCTEREQLVWARLSVLAGSFDLETAEAVASARPTSEATASPSSSLTGPDGASSVDAGGFHLARPAFEAVAWPSPSLTGPEGASSVDGGGFHLARPAFEAVAWPSPSLTGPEGASSVDGGGFHLARPAFEAVAWPSPSLTGPEGASSVDGGGFHLARPAFEAVAWPSPSLTGPEGASSVDAGGFHLARPAFEAVASPSPSPTRPEGASPLDAGRLHLARPAFEDEARSGPMGVQGAEPSGGVEGAEPLEDGTGRGGGGEETQTTPTPRIHPDDVLDAVAGLVDKSVLSRECGPDGTRYRLLDTLRHYGLDRLRRLPGEEAAARCRQRDWMLRRATGCERAWFGPGQREIVARLRADQDNLRTALDFSLTTPGERLTGLRLAGTLWFYWHACGAPREGRHWIDRALAANPEPTRERARGLWIAGLLAAATHALPVGLALAREAHLLAQDLGDAAEAAHAEYVIGVITLFMDDLPAALKHFEATVARGPVPGQHLSLHGLDQVELACALGFLGEAERAVEVCERARRMCERHGEEWVHSYVLRMLALAHSVRGDWQRAEHHARQALRLKLAVHDVTGIALTLDLLARTATETGSHERAAVLLGAADRTWTAVDRDRWGSRSLKATRRDSETRARQALGPPDYGRAYDSGAALDLARAVEYAVDDTAIRKVNDRRTPAHGCRLTRRESEVAELVAQGLANQQIADRLVISRRTAEGHVERILGKLGFSNRSQIAAWVAAQR
ncbi:LuxR C-terminal-related transcriptional regulator [Streptomyces ferrugineus]|uniref:LuxR C-terminal-related transcriptional regulator n=1 Tax=Streptomyces ferrugineus TaxID=1413221 RepID=UPI001D14E0D4|nr:LuxR C-terminal-related transcriptional regulator [Streptomyces ferrugineus]